MTQGLHPLAANMVNQLNRVDVISNNIANANTKGFKEDSLVEGSFNHYLEKAQKKDEPTLKLSEIMNTIPKIDGEYMNQDIGSITQTGNQLDFALNKEDMFFKIQKTDGDIELTRDGSFKVLDGRLVTQNNNNVLDNNNQPIIVGDDNAFATNISVVSTPFNNLKKIGDNNYKINDFNKIETVVNSNENVLQGAIEESNVSTIKSMVTLIEAQRKFEQAQKAVNGIDELNAKVIDSIGNNK
jgi:flagellar basal-body rod protein FlgG